MTHRNSPSWAKFIKILPISRELGIDQGKLYNNARGLYSSLGDDCDRIAELVKPSIEKFFDRLGWKATIKKKPPVD